MMREILFRGLTQNGVWTEGNLLDYPDVNRAYIRAGDYFRTGCTTEVTRETVGQFTGQIDRNGKKIFEDDILRWTADDGENGIVCVKYSGGMFGLYCVSVPSCDPDLFSDFESGEQPLEVIGNAHDNPELLKPDTQKGGQ